jgi:hypothetical protein
LGYSDSEIPYSIFLDSCSMRLAVRPFWASVTLDIVLRLVDLVKEYLYGFLFELHLTTVTLGIELDLADAVTAKDPP